MANHKHSLKCINRAGDVICAQGHVEGDTFTAGASKVAKPSRKMSLDTSISIRAHEDRGQNSLAELKDSLRSCEMEEMLEDGPNWTYARRDQDVYRVKFSTHYDSGFRFECTVAHWNAHQPYPGNR